MQQLPNAKDETWKKRIRLRCVCVKAEMQGGSARDAERESARNGGSDGREKTGREKNKKRGSDQTGFVLITSEGKGGEKQRLCSLDRHFGSNGVFTYQIKPLTQTARSELRSHR